MATGLWIPERKVLVPGQRVEIDRKNLITKDLIGVLDRSTGPNQGRGIEGSPILRPTSYTDIATFDRNGRRAAGMYSATLPVETLPHSGDMTLMAHMKHGPTHETWPGVLYGYWNSNSDNYLFGFSEAPASGGGSNALKASAHTDSSYAFGSGSPEFTVSPGDEFDVRVQVTGWSSPGSGLLHIWTDGTERGSYGYSSDYNWPVNKTGARSFSANSEEGCTYAYVWNRALTDREEQAVRRDPTIIYDLGWDWSWMPFDVPAATGPDLIVDPSVSDASRALPPPSRLGGALMGYYSAAQGFRNEVIGNLGPNPSLNSILGDGHIAEGPYGQRAKGHAFVLYPSSTWVGYGGDWNAGVTMFAIIDPDYRGRLLNRSESESTSNTSAWSVMSWMERGAFSCNIVTSASVNYGTGNIRIPAQRGPIVVALTVSHNYLAGPSYLRVFNQNGEYLEANSGGDWSGLFRTGWSEFYIGGRVANVEGYDTRIDGGIYAVALLKGSLATATIQTIIRETQARLDEISNYPIELIPRESYTYTKDNFFELWR